MEYQRIGKENIPLGFDRKNLPPLDEASDRWDGPYWWQIEKKKNKAQKALDKTYNQEITEGS